MRYSIGNVVYLKSGGPDMVVDEITHEGGITFLVCKWTDASGHEQKGKHREELVRRRFISMKLSKIFTLALQIVSITHMTAPADWDIAAPADWLKKLLDDLSKKA